MWEQEITWVRGLDSVQNYGLHCFEMFHTQLRLQVGMGPLT